MPSRVSGTKKVSKLFVEWMKELINEYSRQSIKYLLSIHYVVSTALGKKGDMLEVVRDAF